MCVLRTIQGTERRNAARLWPGASNITQHGDLSIVLTEREMKDRFEHSKEPNGSFSVGRKKRYEVLFPKRERVFHRGIQTPRNK